MKVVWSWLLELVDLDPDTEENEYREQYYERIAYANEHFASGKPGVVRLFSNGCTRLDDACLRFSPVRRRCRSPRR